eukprot:348215-Hanusia_phi.AAC.1
MPRLMLAHLAVAGREGGAEGEPNVSLLHHMRCDLSAPCLQPPVRHLPEPEPRHEERCRLLRVPDPQLDMMEAFVHPPYVHGFHLLLNRPTRRSRHAHAHRCHRTPPCARAACFEFVLRLERQPAIARDKVGHARARAQEGKQGGQGQSESNHPLMKMISNGHSKANKLAQISRFCLRFSSPCPQSYVHNFSPDLNFACH